jgi:hypothetical protein
MGLPGYQLSAAVEEPLHNLRRGKRLTEQNIDSLFALVIGFRSWNWSITRPKFGMSYATASPGDIDSDPGTENCHDQGQRGQRDSGRRNLSAEA